jgi:uncharacterized phage-associated protein
MIEKTKFNEQRTTETATMLLHLKGGRSDFWWIIKMLYLVDREAYLRWERPITYDHYRSLPYGPVSMSIYDIMKNKVPSPIWKQYILTLPKRKEVMLNGSPAPIRKLSRADEEIINDVFTKFGSMSGKELVEYTHTLPEWKDPKKVGKTTPIDLLDLLDALEYDEEEISRIAAEIAQEEVLDSILGG